MFDYKTKKYKTKSGFTVIELLVTIAIIGVLSSIILVALNRPRADARDARRKADFNEIRKALEFYYDDFGSYPTHSPSLALFHCDSSLGNISCSAPPNSGNWATNIEGLYNLADFGYISVLSKDPVNNSNNHYVYEVCSNGQAYILGTALEGSGGNMYIVSSGGEDSQILQADINHDYIITISDVSFAGSCFGSSATFCLQADMNRDGVIDMDDLSFIIARFGTSC